jgi:hypothetical protein
MECLGILILSLNYGAICIADWVVYIELGTKYAQYPTLTIYQGVEVFL